MNWGKRTHLRLSRFTWGRMNKTLTLCQLCQIEGLEPACKKTEICIDMPLIVLFVVIITVCSDIHTYV